MKALFLGEADFSFTNSISRKPQLLEHIGIQSNSPLQILATSFESLDLIMCKYDAFKQTHEYLLKSSNVTLFHSINAWELSPGFANSHLNLILWNHPHLGTENFKLHKFLMAHFFRSCSAVLCKDGQVVITLVEGQETRWGVVEQARKSGLHLTNVSLFKDENFPGYVSKRNKNNQSFKNIHTKRHVGTSMQSLSYLFQIGAPCFEGCISDIVRYVLRTNGSFDVQNPQDDIKNVLNYSDELTTKPTEMHCPHCPRILGSQRALKQHIHMVHTLALFGTDWSPTRLSTHQCEQCPKMFTDTQSLLQHTISKHSDEIAQYPSSTAANGVDYKFVPCEICGMATIDSEDGKANHLESLKPAIGMKIKCPICENLFIESRALDQHLRVCRSKKQ